MRIAALFSGGKDSTFALYKALQEGHEAVCLISLKPARSDSWMFHTPNLHLVELQAEALGLPLVVQATSGVKEEELDDLRLALQKAKGAYKIEGVVAGAVASEYQYQRVGRICGELGLKVVAPMWKREQEELLREMIDAGFDIIIQNIAAEGLSESWLGRRLDASSLKDLLALQKKTGLNPIGEGGEYDSLALDGPIFKKRIVIEETEKKMEKANCGMLMVKKAKLEDKPSSP